MPRKDVVLSLSMKSNSAFRQVPPRLQLAPNLPSWIFKLWETNNESRHAAIQRDDK